MGRNTYPRDEGPLKDCGLLRPECAELGRCEGHTLLPKNDQELREMIVSNLWRKNFSELLKTEQAIVDELIVDLHARDTKMLEHVIGEDGGLITPEKYNELYPRRSFKDDAAAHYKNKAIAANNELRTEQRERAKQWKGESK